MTTFELVIKLLIGSAFCTGFMILFFAAFSYGLGKILEKPDNRQISIPVWVFDGQRKVIDSMIEMELDARKKTLEEAFDKISACTAAGMREITTMKHWNG